MAKTYKSQVKNHQMALRVTLAQREQLRAEARKAKMTMSDYILGKCGITDRRDMRPLLSGNHGKTGAA